MTVWRPCAAASVGVEGRHRGGGADAIHGEVVVLWWDTLPLVLLPGVEADEKLAPCKICVGLGHFQKWYNAETRP